MCSKFPSFWKIYMSDWLQEYGPQINGMKNTDFDYLLSNLVIGLWAGIGGFLLQIPLVLLDEENHPNQLNINKKKMNTPKIYIWKNLKRLKLGTYSDIPLLLTTQGYWLTPTKFWLITPNALRLFLVSTPNFLFPISEKKKQTFKKPHLPKTNKQHS